MPDDPVNPLLRAGALGFADDWMPPALAALLTHPVHHHDLRGMIEVKLALEIVRAELARAHEPPLLPPPPLPDPARIAHVLGL